MLVITIAIWRLVNHDLSKEFCVLALCSASRRAYLEDTFGTSLSRFIPSAAASIWKKAINTSKSSSLFADDLCVLKIWKIHSSENFASEWYSHHLLLLLEKEKLIKNWVNNEKLENLGMKHYDPQKKKKKKRSLLNKSR